MQTYNTTHKYCSQHLLRVVPSLARLMRRSIRQADPSMSAAQMHILEYVSRCPGASLRQLSSELEVTNATASSHVDRLVKRSLIKRVPDPKERRRVILTITEEGSAALSTAQASCAETFSEMLAAAKPADLDKIRDALLLLEESAQEFTNRTHLEE